MKHWISIGVKDRVHEKHCVGAGDIILKCDAW
jgi:hypothetical protein